MIDSGTVMTVRGPVAGADLGFTLPHEHIYCTLRHADYRYDVADQFVDEDVMADEVQAFADLGGGAIFDLSVPDNGRSPRRLRTLSERTGLHFVMGCGWYRGNYYLPEERIDRRSTDDLAQELIGEITNGVGDTGIRPGVIGEIGSEKDWVSPAEERVLRAVARAHRATGLAIGALHAIGPVAPQQLTILEEEGADMTRVGSPTATPIRIFATYSDSWNGMCTSCSTTVASTGEWAGLKTVSSTLSASCWTGDSRTG